MGPLAMIGAGLGGVNAALSLYDRMFGQQPEQPEEVRPEFKVERQRVFGKPIPYGGV